MECLPWAFPGGERTLRLAAEWLMVEQFRGLATLLVGHGLGEPLVAFVSPEFTTGQLATNFAGTHVY
jgi:hypothetical protein